MRKGIFIACCAVAVGAPVQGETPLVGTLPRDCPRNIYSPWHYRTPQLHRLHAWCQGPKVSVYPPDRAPDVTPTFRITTYHCPAVDPAVSVAQYGALVPGQPSELRQVKGQSVP